MLGFIALLLVDLLVFVLHGLVGAQLWEWFVAEQFGLPTISVPVAIGLALLIGLVTSQHIPRDEDDVMDLIVFSISHPVFVFITGAIVYAFI